MNVLNRLRIANRFNHRGSSQGALFLDLCGVGTGCAAFLRTLRLAGVSGSTSPGLHQVHPPELHQADFEERLSDLKRYSVNIFHAHPRLAIHSRSLDEVQRGRKNIAYWNDIVPFLDGGAVYDEPFDEIWVPSEFLARMVRPRTSLPVEVFSYAIDSSSVPSSLKSRADFGIDKTEILFLARVDLRAPTFLSYPEAAVEAFREAFPHEGRARLVVLLENPDDDPSAARRLGATAGGGVQVIESRLTDDEVRSLLRTTDVYLSLHRLRVEAPDILDAMAAGVSVIATGFSANMEFLDEHNGGLCRFRKRRPTVEEARAIGVFVRPEFEIAEPERRHAATLMRQLAQSSAKRAAIQRSARLAAEKAADRERAAHVFHSCDASRSNRSARKRAGRSSSSTLWWVSLGLELSVPLGLLPFTLIGQVARLFGTPSKPGKGRSPSRDGFEALFQWADRSTLSESAPASVSEPQRPPVRGPASHMLVLTPYVPAPDTYGGGVTIWNNWRSFRELYPDVSLTVLYFCMQPQDLRPQALSWALRLGVLHVFCNRNGREKSPRFNLYPLTLRPWLAKPEALRTVARDLRQHPDSVFVAETILCAPYFPPSEFDCARVLIVHDDLEKTFRQLIRHLPLYRIDEKWVFTQARLRMRQLHAFAFGAFGYTAFLSADDERTLRQSQRTGTKAFFPLSIDCRRIRSQAAGVETRPRRIGFAGFFLYWPNVTAVEWIMKRVLPALRREFPDTMLHAFGSESPKSWARLETQNKGLVVRGFQPEIYRELAQCEVIVNPLFEGTGTRTKLLEAFALGKAVVTTSIGAQGVDVRNERDCLIADTAEEFITAISRLFRDSRLRESIGENARQLADRHEGLRVVSSFWNEFQASVGKSTANDQPTNLHLSQKFKTSGGRDL